MAAVTVNRLYKESDGLLSRGSLKVLVGGQVVQELTGKIGSPEEAGGFVLEVPEDCEIQAGPGVVLSLTREETA